MTRARKTRSALFTSIISLLLCMSMLVGTTFAWFTDVAETGLNQIIAGNLDVALLNAKGENVENSENLFTMPKLWEPGAVAYAQLQVANKGTLDLQASMSINYQDVNSLNGHVLSEVLKYAVIEVSDVTSMSREQVLEAAKASPNKGALNLYDFKFELEPGEESPLQTLVVYWEPNDDDTDNRYNANNGKKPSSGDALQINLGVKVFATQLGGNDNNEHDSFGPDYDANITARVEDPDQLMDALQSGIGAIILDEDVTLPGPVEINSDTILNLNGNTLTVNDQKGITVGENGELTVDNGVISYTSDNYAPFYATSNGVVNIEEGATVSVTSTAVENQWGMAAAVYVNNGSNSVVNINGGVIEVSGTYATGVYVNYTKGGNHTVNFNGGTINVTGKEAIGLEVLSTNTLNLNGGTINVIGEDAVAFNVGTTTVTGNGNTVVNLYDGTALYASNDAARFEGVPFVVKKITNVSDSTEMDNALANAQAGDTIVLNNTTHEVTNIPAGVSIAGNGAENSELTTSVQEGFNVAAGSTISNVTITDNSNEGAYYTGTVNLKGDGATLENVVVNAKGNTTWDAAVAVSLKAGETAYITNVTVNGGFRGIFLGSQSGDVVIDGCYVKPVAYTISVDGGGNFTMTVKNTTLLGWTSHSGNVTATYENCTLGSNGSYAFFRPYSATTLTNCDFEAGYNIDTRFGAVTLVNCTVGGVPVTAENAAQLFHTDSHFDNLTVQ